MEHMPNSSESQECPTEISFRPEMEVEVGHYSLVRVQRGGVTATYRSSPGDEYLKIGAATKIAKDLSIHRELLELGFPVSNILSEGQEGELSYFRESSLGEQTFGEMFAEETKNTG